MEQRIRELLKNHSQVCADIEHSEAQLKNYQEMINMARDISGVSYAGVSVQTSNVSNITAEAAERVEQYNVEITREEKNLEDLYNRRYLVNQLMLTIDADDREIIKHRFFERLRWNQVRRLVNYSDKQVRRRCDAAIRRMGFEVIKNDDLFRLMPMREEEEQK